MRHRTPAATLADLLFLATCRWRAHKARKRAARAGRPVRPWETGGDDDELMDVLREALRENGSGDGGQP